MRSPVPNLCPATLSIESGLKMKSSLEYTTVWDNIVFFRHFFMLTSVIILCSLFFHLMHDSSSYRRRLLSYSSIILSPDHMSSVHFPWSPSWLFFSGQTAFEVLCPVVSVVLLRYSRARRSPVVILNFIITMEDSADDDDISNDDNKSFIEHYLLCTRTLINTLCVYI